MRATVDAFLWFRVLHRCDLHGPAQPTVGTHEERRVLTRSLPALSGCLVIVLDRAPWRLVVFVELDEAWWCVPGDRRLGVPVVVGRA
jgi:hypothetical protein